MINKFQTLSLIQSSSSSSKAEMAQITDHCQEEIVMCNADSGSSTTRASIAQGMYTFSTISSSIAFLLHSILHAGNVNVKDRKITLVCMFAGNEVDELSCPDSNKVVKELSGDM